MNDFEMYQTGYMNPDEQEQWEYVTEMMASRGEYDGHSKDHPDYFVDEVDEEYEKENSTGIYVPCDEIPF